ncbi:hypothetical protein D3C81_1642650 [compost metagenome]
MRHIALQVHLRFFPLRRSRQGHHPKDPRAHALSQRLDRAAFARTITAFKHNDHLGPRGNHPLLQLHQLDVQGGKLLLVVLATERRGRLRFRKRLFLLAH